MTRHHLVTEHTDWCGRGHHCNLGEHRSEPTRWNTPYGAVVATLVQPDTGRASLELRISVRLDPSEHTTRREAAAIATGIDHLLRDLTTRYRTRRVTR